jgi:hypothetical protein
VQPELPNETLTNLFVGLHRDARGDHLAAMRLIQVHAVDPLARIVAGYAGNGVAALAILEWLEERAAVNAQLARAIRALADLNA